MTVTVTDLETSLEVQSNFDHVIGILDRTEQDFRERFFKKVPNRTMFWFDDIVSTRHGNPPTLKHIEDMITLIKEKKLDAINSNVLVHCRAGISRSTACAIGLLIMRGKSIEQSFRTIHLQRPEMWPNELVLKHFDDLLGLDGKLLEHDKTWKAKHRFRFNIPEDWDDSNDTT